MGDAGSGDFSYTLDNYTGIAQISFTEGPVGGGEASFITHAKKDDTRLSFFCTSRVSGGFILKPIIFTFDHNLLAWIVFYPVYTSFLDWWTPKKKSDAVCLSLVKNAKNILASLIEAHKVGVAHGNLEEISNYAIVGNEQTMLLNFKKCRDKETDEEWRAVCLDDIEAFLKKLLTLLPAFRLNDHAMIMRYLSTMKTCGRGTSDELLLYPYWKCAYKRMMVYFDASCILENDVSRLRKFETETKKIGIVTLPWDTRFIGRIVIGDDKVEDELKIVYRDGYYDGESVQSLVIFLRDVYTHAKTRGSYEEVDRYLSKKYPAFVSFVHFCVKC